MITSSMMAKSRRCLAVNIISSRGKITTTTIVVTIIMWKISRELRARQTLMGPATSIVATW